jgi:hypothetical protein
MKQSPHERMPELLNRPQKEKPIHCYSAQNPWKLENRHQPLPKPIWNLTIRYHQAQAFLQEIPAEHESHKSVIQSFEAKVPTYHLSLDRNGCFWPILFGFKLATPAGLLIILLCE